MMKNDPLKVSVRDATIDDLGFMVDCNCKLAEETEGKSLDRALLVEGIKRGFANTDLCRYFIAELNGRPVGITMLTYELTDWRDGVIWWLQSVYVLPEFRNMGVFRTVYRHIDRLARNSTDVRALRLYVRHDNTRAIETYNAMGMTDAGYIVLEDDRSEGEAI